MALLKRRVLRWVFWLRRHPGLIAAFGFVSGLLSFLLVERHEGVARLMAVAMLASWVLLVVERALSKAVSARFGFGLSPMLVRYLTQFTHQESLFFALPFFVASTSWSSGQALFTGLLGVMALVTIIDPVYFGRLAKRRWLFLSFHTLTLFALLLVVLPLVLQVPAMQSYQLALGVTVMLSFPSLAGSITVPRWWRGMLVLKMKQYQDLLKHILENGTEKTDRTGTGTISVFGYQMRFDLSDGFPLLTTKKLHLKSIIYELLWFLNGDTNIGYLTENGVRIWNEWADANGDLGPIYGKQWRSWSKPNGESVDQISKLIHDLMTNPDSRRMIVNAWSVGELDHGFDALSLFISVLCG